MADIYCAFQLKQSGITFVHKYCYRRDLCEWNRTGYMPIFNLI